MASLLPPVPRLIFTTLEPLSLLAGFLGPLLSSSFFITSQLPSSQPSRIIVNETSQLLAWQLGNCYLLLGLLGVFILNTTTERGVVDAYLWALWLGDIGHVVFTVYAMGWEDTMHIAGWNAVIWGNIGATSFLFLARSMYFAGLFGKARVPTAPFDLQSRTGGKGKKR